MDAHAVTGDLVVNLIGLHSGFSETTKIFLSIPVETIIPFGSKPMVDVIAVPD